MKRITSIEIQCLKELLKDYRDRNIMLSIENEELRKQLEESRAKEGKGSLEQMIDGIADAFANMGKMFSTMNPDDLKARIIEDEYMTCEDCDFDKEENNNE